MQPHDDVVVDSTERLFNAQDVLIYFSGLIIENWGIVRLAHFSIKEYLVSNRMRQDLVSTFSFSDIDAHLFIAYSCLSYLSYMSTLANEGDKETRSLEIYANSNCLIHLEMVPSEHWHVGVIDKLAQALAIRSQSLLNVMSYFIGESSDIVRDLTSIRLLDLHLRPYYLTAYHGFVRLTGCLLSQAFSSSKYLTQGDLNTALWYAVYGGRKEVAVLLLERGADPNTSRTTSDVGYKYEKHGDVLQIAVSKGDAVMVNLLLDRGADINAQRWGSALQTAVDRGHLDILKLLVGRAANINGPSNEKRGVLHAAIPHEKCFQFLLDSGADVNMRNQWGETALCEAARFKCLKQFDLLLENGADVNLGGEGGYPLEQLIRLGFEYPHGDTSDALSRIKRLLRLGADPNAQALHAAVVCMGEQDTSYHLRVTQHLIDHGADVNIRACVDTENGWATEGEQREPQPLLYYCAYHGCTPTAKLLLQNGATTSVNLQAGDYGNALQAASYVRKIEMMRLLLDHGAQVNAQGGRCGTALNAACRITSDNDAIPAVQLLLEHGADVNLGNGETGFALQTVCARSSPNIATTTLLAQILLDHAADINARGGKYGTALQAACVHNPEIVHLLLDRGADINAAGGKFGTALQIACARNPGIVHLLLEHGADINAEGGKYGTALQAASHQGNRDVTQLLLDRGANVNAEGGELGTALQAALKGFDRKSVQLLLDRGADVNANGGLYGSCLQIACANRHTFGPDGGMEMIRTLLQRGADPQVQRALQAAAYSGQAKTVQLLLSRKDHKICNKPCGKYGSALNAAVIRAHWDIVDVLLKAGAIPDCHVLQEPDQDFLARIREEHGWAAEERYKKFWEVEKKSV
ncbi:hypothetical protein ACHAPE_008490 [Trichoderma viride]